MIGADELVVHDLYCNAVYVTRGPEAERRRDSYLARLRRLGFVTEGARVFAPRREVYEVLAREVGHFAEMPIAPEAAGGVRVCVSCTVGRPLGVARPRPLPLVRAPRGKLAHLLPRRGVCPDPHRPAAVRPTGRFVADDAGTGSRVALSGECERVPCEATWSRVGLRRFCPRRRARERLAVEIGMAGGAVRAAGRGSGGGSGVSCPGPRRVRSIRGDIYDGRTPMDALAPLALSAAACAATFVRVMALARRLGTSRLLWGERSRVVRVATSIGGGIATVPAVLAALELLS